MVPPFSFQTALGIRDQMLIRFVKICTWAALAVLLASYGGGVHPIGDTLAVGRPHLILALVFAVIILLALKVKILPVFAVLCAILAGAPIAYGFLKTPTPNEGQFTLYQKNLLFRAWPRYPLMDEIIDSGAEFVTLQEVSTHNLRFMAGLFEDYPTKLLCEFRAVGAVAVLTRYPVVDGSQTCGQKNGYAAVQVVLPDNRKLWLVSIHLYWPYPSGQGAQVKNITRWLETLEGDILIGGDFNMMPWGHSVRKITKTANAHRVGPYRVTFDRFLPWLVLPIDHVLLPQSAIGGVETRPHMGSDHLGLISRFTY